LPHASVFVCTATVVQQESIPEATV
jgi:hypothetical protein